MILYARRTNCAHIGAIPLHKGKLKMKFFVILTVFAQPVDVASNTPLTLEPQTVIEFRNTTENNTAGDCNRVMKALGNSNILAFCSPVAAIPGAAE